MITHDINHILYPIHEPASLETIKNNALKSIERLSSRPLLSNDNAAHRFKVLSRIWKKVTQLFFKRNVGLSWQNMFFASFDYNMVSTTNANNVR